ncbi:uncharacterized protein JCM15063_002557 [Sporobolomyces koalae]|uniref:uncharacterized protein n=1 Tax=Sporobolomyces koalae TaxID=500713 RepID=UPI00317F2AA8
MSLAAVAPSVLPIPDAPRIGTAGSPLDPPLPANRGPQEGLGLGGIDMPEGMKGTVQALEDARAQSNDRRVDGRYAVFQQPRIRHAASVSSPPSLIPFIKSLAASTNASTSSQPSAPQNTYRKYSLQSAPLKQSYGHARKVSEDMISYPIVTRTDSASTFTPDSERRPAPMPSTVINDSQPPASARPTTDLDQTPVPSQPRRTSRPRSPPPPLDLGFPGASNFAHFPLKKPMGSTAKARRASDESSTKSKLEKASLKSSASSIASRLEGLRISRVRFVSSLARRFENVPIDIIAPKNPAQSSYPSSSHYETSEDDASPDLRDNLPTFPTVIPVSRVHRRTVSEESPRIVQAVTFSRAKSAEDVNPSEVLKQSTRTWNTASPALIPISEVKAAKAKANSRLQGDRTATSSPVRRLSAVSSRPSSSKPVEDLPRPSSAGSLNSIGISVKDTLNASSRDMGKASMGRNGITICLKSYNRPEDLEVSWSVVPRVDEDGKAYTQWEMKFSPRVSTPTTSGPPPSQPLPPVPMSSFASTANSNFLNYRMNAPNPGSAGRIPRSTERPQPSTISPSQPVDPLAAVPCSATVDRRRKSSSTSISTSRSDSFSTGTSFSSESSLALPTPPGLSHTFASGRRRKSSTPGHLHSSSHDFDSCPPLPAPSYFDIPVPPTSLTESTSPSRTSRASSYNAGRTRQLSIDPGSTFIPRSASVPEVGLYASASVGNKVKSPARDNRLARCLPPTSEAHVDLALLASDDLPHNSFAASRSTRKASIAPPATLSLPIPTTETGSFGLNPTSPFTPSPLGRSFAKTVGPDSEQCRTPTKTQFKPKLTTTPSPSPPPLVQPPALQSIHQVSMPASKPSVVAPTPIVVESLDPAYGQDGSISEELSQLSPSLSIPTEFNQGHEDDDDDEEEEDVEFDNRLAQLRQGHRMMSRWSDTETEEDEVDSAKIVGLTSWGRIPDSITTDEES